MPDTWDITPTDPDYSGPRITLYDRGGDVSVARADDLRVLPWVLVPVTLLQYIDQRSIRANGDRDAARCYNSALEGAFPDGLPGGCGGFIDLAESGAGFIDGEPLLVPADSLTEAATADEDHPFTDLFGDGVFVGTVKYTGHPQVGDACGVVIKDADDHPVGVFAPEEARLLGEAIITTANLVAAQRAIDQQIADGRLVRLPSGSLIEAERAPEAS